MRPLPLREDQVTDLVRELYHGHTLRESEVSESELDHATEAAIELIILAGFDEGDSDHWGAEMGDIVQSLLTVVMLRVPQLRERLTDHEIVLDATV
jgi:hypothetical protein